MPRGRLPILIVVTTLAATGSITVRSPPTSLVTNSSGPVRGGRLAGASAVGALDGVEPEHDAAKIQLAAKRDRRARPLTEGLIIGILTIMSWWFPTVSTFGLGIRGSGLGARGSGLGLGARGSGTTKKRRSRRARRTQTLHKKAGGRT